MAKKPTLAQRLADLEQAHAALIKEHNNLNERLEAVVKAQDEVNDSIKKWMDIAQQNVDRLYTNCQTLGKYIDGHMHVLVPWIYLMR